MNSFFDSFNKNSKNNVVVTTKTNEKFKNSTDKDHLCKVTKTRKYDPSYLSFGFTSVIANGIEKPMCLLCSKVLAADSMRPAKLKRHLEKNHSENYDKSLDFFKRKLEEKKKQKQIFSKSNDVSSNALLASYHVSYRIAKCKKPHTIGENLVLPAAMDIVRTMFGESYAKQLQQIPLSDNTVGRRINDISEDLCEQLISELRISKFAIQVDEAVDVAKDAHLIAYVRYVSEADIKEDILFCHPICEKATSNELFNIIDNFFDKNDLPWDNCIGICTDGAQSMSGCKSGLQALAKRKAPRITWTHCMLHRAALVSKRMSEELYSVFNIVIKIINYIKNSPLRARMFAKLCKDMDSNFTSLLYYCEIRWLSRAIVIQRVYALKDEIIIFLEENNSEYAILFRNDNFLTKLAYLVEIFTKLSVLNKSMQGGQTHVLVQQNKINAFMKKIELWKSNLEKNKFDMFPTLNQNCSLINIEANKKLFLEHLNNLLVHFSYYFHDLDLTRFAWIQNPFIDEEDEEFGLTTIEKEKLIELSCDTSLKKIFQSETIFQFWLNRREEYKILSDKAINILLPFVTSYLCETGFSALAAMKPKYRARLAIEKELRVAVSSITPRFNKLCAKKQAHISH